MSQFFITGTDTGVGKTLVSAVLTRALSAHYWKPIQSGLADEVSDEETVKTLTGLTHDFFLPSTYSLQASLAPYQAAQLESVAIDLKHCQLPRFTSPLIVEGAGGIYVPLTANECILHLIQRFKLPVIIVARGTLGTINHTLLTITVLRQNNIPVKGVIFSGDLTQENQAAIESWGKIKTLFHVPVFKQLEANGFQNWVDSNKQKIIEALR